MRRLVFDTSVSMSLKLRTTSSLFGIVNQNSLKKSNERSHAKVHAGNNFISDLQRTWEDGLAGDICQGQLIFAVLGDDRLCTQKRQEKLVTVKKNSVELYGRLLLCHLVWHSRVLKRQWTLWVISQNNN